LRRRNRKGRGSLDKKVLQEYIDACELVRETEKDIQKLNQKKRTVLQTNVKGSSPSFPYTEQQFRIQGSLFSVADDDQIRYEAGLLKRRKEAAEEIKRQVEEWMLTIPARMQRIIKYKYLEGMTWEQTAARIGRKATGDSLRMEMERFFKKN